MKSNKIKKYISKESRKFKKYLKNYKKTKKIKKNNKRIKYKKTKKNKKYIQNIQNKKNKKPKKFIQKGGNLIGNLWDEAIDGAKVFAEGSMVSDLGRTVAEMLLKRGVKFGVVKATEAGTKGNADSGPVTAAENETAMAVCTGGTLVAKSAAKAGPVMGALATGVGIGTGLGITESLSQGQKKLGRNYSNTVQVVHQSQSTANDEVNSASNTQKEAPEKAVTPAPRTVNYQLPGAPGVQ